MPRTATVLVLTALTVGAAGTVQAGVFSFLRGERSQPRSERVAAHPAQPERLAAAPRLIPPVERPAAGLLMQVPPAPAPYGEPLLTPMPHPAEPPLVLPSQPIELYRNVKYDDIDEAHPCGVKQLVAVKDPRSCPRACKCCVGRVVFVEVCVPPTGVPRVKVSRDGRKVKLDYGKYEIEVESKRGYVEVEYDD